MQDILENTTTICDISFNFPLSMPPIGCATIHSGEDSSFKPIQRIPQTNSIYISLNDVRSSLAKLIFTLHLVWYLL